MEIDPTLFWDNFFDYFFNLKYIRSLISLGSSRTFPHCGIGRFIDDFCATNNSDEFLDFF